MIDNAEDRFRNRRIITDKGQYDILEPIAEGGMGIVYRALGRPRGADDASPGQEVAVKFLKEEIATAPKSQIDRFYIETYALQNLIHPNIVRLLDYGVTTHRFMVFEYLDGHSLLDELSTGSLLKWRRAEKILDQAFEALKYAHSQNIYNRDVKPGNIHILENDLVKLLDFGAAKVDDPDFHTVTKTGEFIGSLHYIPPEVLDPVSVEGIDNSRLLVAREIYSAGAVLYHLLTGTTPFNAESEQVLGYQILHRENLISPSKRAPLRGIPQNLDDITMRAIARHPDERFETIADLQYAIKSVGWNGLPRMFWAGYDFKRTTRFAVKACLYLAAAAAVILPFRYPDQAHSFLTNTHRGVSSFYNNHIRPYFVRHNYNPPKLEVPERQYTISINSNVSGASVYQSTTGKLDSLGTTPFTCNFSGDGQHVLLVKNGKELQQVTVSPTNTDTFVQFTEPVPVKSMRSR